MRGCEDAKMEGVSNLYVRLEGGKLGMAGHEKWIGTVEATISIVLEAQYQGIYTRTSIHRPALYRCTSHDPIYARLVL